MHDKIYKGAGSPENVRWGSKGTVYMDLNTGFMYGKTTDGLTGWTQFFPAVPAPAPVIIQVAWDDADRANGAAGTTPTGQVWRSGFGGPATVINNKQFTANAGAATYQFTDIPGLEETGIVSYYQMITNIAAGDAWLYACFSEGTPSGIICQRGSDRIRVGTQVGGSVTWAQENLIGAPGVMERITLKVDTTPGGGASTATIILNGSAYAPVTLPAVTFGTTTGMRLSGTAVADHWRVLRQEVL
jgi:hypothetical protein